MNIVDIIILGVVGISVIYGFYHGFIHTVASLAAALLSIAAAFSFGPRVVLLDEPTSALDTITSRSLLKNLAAYVKQEDVSLILISHDPGLTDEYAESRILFEEGCRITGEGGGSHE